MKNYKLLPPPLLQLVKYCLVGGVNTLVCAAVIFTLMHYGLSLYGANISGYIVGVLFSYVLNSLFTFDKKIELKTSIKFVVSVVISWVANFITITVALHFLPGHPYIVQCMGMVVYTIIGFVINKMWAMK